MRCAGKSTGSKSHQHDVINFWAFLIFHLPTGLGQHCWLNVVLYSSGYYRNVEDKMLPRALCKSVCPAHRILEPEHARMRWLRLAVEELSPSEAPELLAHVDTSVTTRSVSSHPLCKGFVCPGIVPLTKHKPMHETTDHRVL
ncbi:hypothetical protein BD310DRAFT_917208 [Dichomitus squalens]|uniref:Uncharacterized protein n=1 Tax=Dichomitus squalens TaxID=114155 RepID=A0A4Q9Q8E0_9APHY|nr:hypothetical protein BD310DRAFT_917208 [Dichomitus squalens]